MFIPMACTLMLSRHLVIRFGGIGVTTPTVGDGTMAGAGIVLTMAGDITRVHGAAGMVATGVVGMVVAIGDIITIGTAVLAGAGVVEAIGHAIIPIIITDAPIMVLMEEVHDVLPMQPVETVELVQV